MINGPIKHQLISAFLVIIVLLVSLFSTDFDKQRLNTPELKNKTTIVFSHLDYRADKLYTQRENPLAEIIQEFEKAHPTIHVEEQVLPYNTTQRHQYYSINFGSANRYIDVVAMDVIWIQEFARAGWLFSIDHDDTPSPSTNDFLHIYQDVTGYNNQRYAIPWIFNAGVLYYRNDYLKKYKFSPPKTYEELVNQVQTILSQEKNRDLYGFLWAGKQYEGLICVALEFIYGHGSNLLSNNTVDIKDPNIAKSLSFMRYLISSGVTPDLVLTDTGNATRQYFLEGKGLFIRNWLHHHRHMLNNPIFKDKIHFSALPSFAGYNSSPVLGGDALGISKFSSHPRESYQFIQFLTSYSAQKQLSQKLGFLPTRYSLYRDPVLLQKYPYFAYILTEIIPHVRTRPLTPYYLIISNILQSEFSAIIAGIRKVNTSLSRIKSQVNHILSIDSVKKD